ncbi:hypothetical protein V6N13_135264 [Hibiscus sabdariffa]
MVGNGVKKQIEKKSGGDEKRIVLVLHDGFLVTEMLGRSARIGFAAGAGFEEATRNDDQALVESVEVGECEEEYHDSFCTGSIAKQYPI